MSAGTWGDIPPFKRSFLCGVPSVAMPRRYLLERQEQGKLIEKKRVLGRCWFELPFSVVRILSFDLYLGS